MFSSVEWMITLWIIAKIIDYLSVQYWIGIYWCIASFAIIKIIGKILQIPGNYLNVSLDSKTSQWLSRQYLKQYIGLDMNATDMIGTGKMIWIYHKWIGSWTSFLQNVIEIVARIWAIIIGWIFVFGTLVWWQSLIFFGCFLISVAVIWKGMNALNGIRKQSRELGLDLNRQEAKVFMSKMEILQQNKIWEELSDIHTIYDKQNNLWTNNMRKKVKWEVLWNSIIDVLMIVFMLLAAAAVAAGKYQLSAFIVATTLLSRILAYVWDARNMMRSYFGVMISIEKMWDVFDSTPPIKWLYEGEKFDYIAGTDLEISDLSFGYHLEKEKTPVFSHFSLKIAGGKKTALVGPSGGGKSTLLKLLAGILRSQEGNIFVGKQSLPSDSHKKNWYDIVSLQSYFAHIWYLSQDPSIFDGTIYQNLVYALDKEPDLVYLKHILSQAECDFVWEFPDGLSTEIGERGIRLSGGQKQRLAIAKIMLKNPSIILLDEPTSALDSFNEERISIALRNLFEGKTVVVVAHRLQTVKASDHIFFIDSWTIVEQGNHKSLVEKKWQYAQMLELQTGF